MVDELALAQIVVCGIHFGRFYAFLLFSILVAASRRSKILAAILPMVRDLIDVRTRLLSVDTGNLASGDLGL